MRRRVAPGTRIGLVLGAGGTVGCAYHAGVLSSLLHHTGWDAREATSIVGTSAGSLVGALLRCDVDPVDLVAITRGSELSARNAARLERLRAASEMAPPTTMAMLRAFRPPTPAGWMATMRHRSLRPAMLSMARHGIVDLRPMVAELDTLVHDAGTSGWPTRDLRICTVDARSGRRRVIDGSRRVPLSTAVAASCAVPGLFAPQRVGSQRLVDGGVHSVTNLDALDMTQLDEVWVVAPMAGRTFSRLATRSMQRKIAITLRRELRTVPKGMRVRMFIPGAESFEAMGGDLMAPDRSEQTILAGFLEAGDVIAADVDGDLVTLNDRDLAALDEGDLAALGDADTDAVA